MFNASRGLLYTPPPSADDGAEDATEATAPEDVTADD